MKIMVFGAGGFIGAYLTNRLIADGHTVVASDINEFGEGFYQGQGIVYHRVDVTQRSAFATLPADNLDAVVNLACVQPANVSEQKYDPADYIRVNVLGTLNILEFCRVHRLPKLIYTCSHRNTQGMWAEKGAQGVRESDGRSIKFTGDYAMFSISESAAADCVEHYSQTYGIDGVVLRLPPVYGYGPHTEIFKDGKPLKTGFQVFIENAEQGRPLEVWGDSDRGRDIVYVKDVASAIALALERPAVHGVYNIASGRRFSLREQAESIVRVFSQPGHPSEIRYLRDRPNDMESYHYEIDKAHRTFGWQPQYRSFDDMLIDYRQERKSGRFGFLVEKRRSMMREASGTPGAAGVPGSRKQT